jgi:hypothetical protein
MRGELMLELIKKALEEIQIEGVKSYFDHLNDYIQDALEKKDL